MMMMIMMIMMMMVMIMMTIQGVESALPPADYHPESVNGMGVRLGRVS